MITISLANIKQNIRVLKRTGKKVFADLSFNAYGLGGEDMFRNLMFEADGFVFDCNAEVVSMISSLRSRRPTIFARSHIEPFVFAGIAYNNHTATLHSINDFNALAGHATSTGVLRVMLEIDTGSGYGLKVEEAKYVMSQVQDNAAYSNVIVNGFLLDYYVESVHQQLKTSYPTHDVCCYDDAEHSDFIIASKLLFGYASSGVRTLSMHRACVISGNILNYSVVGNKVFYVTDIPASATSLDYPILVNGEETAEIEDVSIGAISYIGFYQSKQQPFPKRIELVYPDEFSAIVEQLNQPKYVSFDHSSKPLN